jgi:hypothetical protein
MKKLSKKKKKELRRLLARPDSEIDLTDIPEIADWSEALVGKFYQPKCERHRIPTTGCAGEAAQAVETAGALSLCHA